MEERVLLNRNIFVSFDLPFHRYHFYLLLRHYFFVVLDALFNSVKVLFHHFMRNSLDYFSLLVGDDLSPHRHFFNIGAILVLNHLLLVGHVAYSTLTCIPRTVPFTTYSPFTCDETSLLASLRTREPPMLGGGEYAMLAAFMW